MIAASLIERSLNHLLQQSPGASELLGRHVGQHVRFDLVFKQFDFRIAEDGGLTEAVAATPDATIRPTPALFTRLPFFGREALRHADYSGDAALLHTLDKVFRNLHWDIEADLAPVFGDIAAHRLSTTGSAALRTLHQNAQSLHTSASEYVVEEIGLMARKIDVARHNREVDALVDDVARLEARLERMRKSTADSENTAA